MSMASYLQMAHCKYAKSETYILTEALTIVTACKEQVPVQMKVI